MNTDEILHDLASLPPEAQRQVADFIALLLARYGLSTLIEDGVPSHTAPDNFVGMWRDRVDLKDSSAWVRIIREREWGE